jgi:hypothetical protein
MTRALVIAGGVVALAAGCGGGGSTTVTVARTVTTSRTVTVTTTPAAEAAPACLGSGLSGTFAVIPGSAGAGQIAYGLRLVNESDHPSSLTGIPKEAQLLGTDGAELPTTVFAERPSDTPEPIELAPGDAAVADARFSPDVPGGSEQGDNPCEPKSASLRVVVGSASVEVPVQPPTPVCERGSLGFRNFETAS